MLLYFLIPTLQFIIIIIIIYYYYLLFIIIIIIYYLLLLLLLLLTVEFNVIEAYPSLKAGSSSSRTHQSFRYEIPCTATLPK